MAPPAAGIASLETQAVDSALHLGCDTEQPAVGIAKENAFND
ncbi:MAG: hypothetical protein ACYT04_35925 [Nostoc sp.]